MPRRTHPRAGGRRRRFIPKIDNPRPARTKRPPGPPPDQARCPVTGKRRYQSQQAAEQAIKTIVLTGHRSRAFHPYQCRHCDGWHTTSQGL